MLVVCPVIRTVAVEIDKSSTRPLIAYHCHLLLLSLMDNKIKRKISVKNIDNFVSDIGTSLFFNIPESTPSRSFIMLGLSYLQFWTNLRYPSKINQYIMLLSRNHT